jgi:hypothetical protein
VGYDGLSLAAARKGMQELGKKHDKEKLMKAAEELTEVTD